MRANVEIDQKLLDDAVKNEIKRLEKELSKAQIKISELQRKISDLEYSKDKVKNALRCIDDATNELQGLGFGSSDW